MVTKINRISKSAKRINKEGTTPMMKIYDVVPSHMLEGETFWWNFVRSVRFYKRVHKIQVDNVIILCHPKSLFLFISMVCFISACADIQSPSKDRQTFVEGVKQIAEEK